MPETAAEICVHVRLFASYREAAGASRLDMPLRADASVADLIELLAVRIPGLRATRGLIAINHSYVNSNATLADGDEVALIPPVSGG